jgi:putative ATP-binding cassette transporter
LLKALTFLYRPLSGSILWDGTPISQDNINDYRNLFATVFWDFHIFDRLYGQPDRTKEEVNGLLEEFNINHLTQYENGEFTRTDLSTGQRKRLALAVAILERRPILVLDEVAAEQDAEFRERFYRNIVPQLKAEGRTILISSHDDRYFDTADHIVILRDGRIAKEDT